MQIYHDFFTFFNQPIIGLINEPETETVDDQPSMDRIDIWNDWYEIDHQNSIGEPE